jgi:hypothetical protein
VRGGIAEALGGGGAAPVGPFGASASTTMELAWGWKVEEAPVAQLLGRSRCNGTARSTAVPRYGQAARGLHERAAAIRPVGSDRFNRVGWYCRHVLGPIRCTTFFQLFKLCSNFEIQNKDYPDVHKCSNLACC